MLQAERVGPQLLGFAHPVVFRIARREERDLGRVLGPELSLGPGARPVGDLVLGDVGRVPRHRQEEFDRQFERLQVADIGDPHLVRAVLVGEVHLLPDLGQRIRIDPLVRERPAVHVHVEIHAEATLAAAFGGRRQATQIADIVVRQHQRHVVGDLQPGIVIFIDFGEQHPHLRHLFGGLAHALGDDAPLVGDDAFEQFDVGLDTAGALQRDIAVAAHPDRHDDLVFAIADDPLAEEFGDRRPVGRIVPRAVAIVLAVVGPFLVRAHHRLVMRRAHHDAELLGERSVRRIVDRERIVPHRRPQVIGPQPEQQLEQLAVELRVHPAEFLGGPARQARGLVIQEDAAILHRGRSLHIAATRDAQVCLLHDGHVGPPIPGRHADHPRQVVRAIDRTTLVATDDHQRLDDARQRVGDRLDDERFPCAADAGDVEFAAGDQPVDQRAMADRADQDDPRGQVRAVADNLCRGAGHATDIGGQIARGPPDAGQIVRIDEHGHHAAVRSRDVEPALAPVEAHSGGQRRGDQACGDRAAHHIAQYVAARDHQFVSAILGRAGYGPSPRRGGRITTAPHVPPRTCRADRSGTGDPACTA